MCPGTAAYHAINGLSLDTIWTDSCSNILAIAQFNSFIRAVLPYNSIPPDQQLISAQLTSPTNRKHLTQSPSSTTSEPVQKQHHSGCLQPLIIIGPIQPAVQSLERLFCTYVCWCHWCGQKTIYVPFVNVRDDVVKNESEAYVMAQRNEWL